MPYEIVGEKSFSSAKTAKFGVSPGKNNSCFKSPKLNDTRGQVDSSFQRQYDNVFMNTERY